MDQTERDHIQHELEITANELLPGWIRRVELLQHDDAQAREDGEIATLTVFDAAPGSTSSGTTC